MSNKKHKNKQNHVKSYLSYFILIVFLVFSFYIVFWFLESKNYISKKEEVVSKKIFFVETLNFWDFSSNTMLKKVWKIEWAQDISLSSNALWRINNLYVKQWDEVKKWQTIATLEDNVGNYLLNLEKSKNILDKARINYESQKILLDKQVLDAQLNLDKVEKNYDSIKKSIDQNIKKAQNDLSNLDLTNSWSKSNLDLEKLDNTIAKLELDYQNKLLSDSETLYSFLSSIKKDHLSLSILIDDVVEFWDSLLWVTPLHRDDELVDDIRDFLWAYDIGQKNKTKDNLIDIINYKDLEFDNLEFSDTSKIIDYLSFLSTWYQKTKTLLDSLEKTLNNSVNSEWNLSLSDLSSYSSSVNLFQTTLQGNYTSFISFDSSTRSFLRTYELSQESLLKQIELAKKDREILENSLSTWEFNAQVWYNTTVINSVDSINNIENQLTQSKNNLENAIKTREVSLKSLENSIDEANINYLSSQKEYSKLTIKSPIDWVIWDVFVDLWQEVYNWTNLFSIFSEKEKEIDIYFSKNDLNYVKVWDKLSILYSWKSYNWTIVSISKVADNNLNYNAKVHFDNLENDFIGDLVELEIPIKLDNKLVPINYIDVVWEWKWILKEFKDHSFSDLYVDLWNVWWDYIEVLSKIDDYKEIITSDVSNFDEAKFIINKK